MQIIKKEKHINTMDYGSEGVIRTDVFQFSKEQTIKLKIHSSASSRKQGVALASENGLNLSDGIKKRTVILWDDRLNSEHIITCSEGTLNIFNVWEDERLVGCHDYLSGMRIEKSNNGFIYNCNAGYSMKRFKSIVFSIEFL